MDNNIGLTSISKNRLIFANSAGVRRDGCKCSVTEVSRVFLWSSQFVCFFTVLVAGQAQACLAPGCRSKMADSVTSLHTHRRDRQTVREVGKGGKKLGGKGCVYVFSQGAVFGASSLVRFGSVRFSTGFLRVCVLVLTLSSLPPLRFGLSVCLSVCQSVDNK